jgi:DNA polymerase III subunit beta
MKFIVSSGVLYKSLQTIAGVITTNPGAPIIENFKFDINKNKLKVTATDGETTMNVTIEIQCSDKAVICVESKMLLDFLKNLGEQPLTFDVNLTDYKIEFTSDEGNYSIPGENAEQYPLEPEAEDTSKVEIKSNMLVSGINKTIFAVSNDEIRPAMTGVYFELDPNHLTLVATDAHRLVRYRLTDVKCTESKGLIVPKKPLSQLKNILPTDTTPITLSYNQEFMFVTHGNINLACRLKDAKYPDYKMVIPSNNPYKLVLNRAEFLSALRRVSVFANKTTNLLVLKINGSELRLFAQDVEYAHEGKERMACQYEGEDMDIAFNAKFLLDLISAIDNEEIVIELSTPSRAGIIKPNEVTEGEDLLMLSMPLMING